MPAYDENPTSQAVLKRTRERISTIRSALMALALPSTPAANERARQASKNLEMLLDRKEMRQVSQLTEHAAELNARFLELKSACGQFRPRQLVEPDRAARLGAAIEAFVGSPLANGTFIGGSDNLVSQEAPVQPTTEPPLHAEPHAEPTAPPPPFLAARAGDSDSFELVLRDEAFCKAAATCPRLTVRSRFHEPNVRTLDTWQSNDGFYLEGIDRRVAFICESPSKTPDPPTPDFVVEHVAGYRCWSGYNARNTNRFTELRQLHGFENCFITNVVKCGVQAGKPDADDIARCAQFLWRELNLVQPAVIACVGKATLEMVTESMRRWPGQLASRPSVVYLTHYSAASRGMSEKELLRRWQVEVDGIKAELRRRRLPDDESVFMPMPASADS